MTNIHPIFVHFPIALLTMYSICEIFQWRKLRAKFWFRYVKATLLLSGTFFGFIALFTGGMAENAIGRSALIETHSSFASASIWVFGIISIFYIIEFTLESTYLINFPKFGNVLNKIDSFLKRHHFVLPILSFVGLILVTIAGALGGAIVYGPDIDPVVSFIYHLFF